MRITIENLGPIKNGVIDLNKSLTIITGPNNTGKSYLTYLIQGISQYVDIAGLLYVREQLTKYIGELEFIDEYVRNEGDINLVSFFNSNVDGFSYCITDIIQANLFKIFASSFNESNVSIGFENIRHNPEIQKSDVVELFRVTEGRFQSVSYNGRIEEELYYKQPFDTSKDIKSLLVRMLYITVSFGIEQIVRRKTYFFPAERTAINLFAKHITSTKAEIKDELDAEVLTSMSDEELGRRIRNQAKAAPKYPYAIRSYINFVNGFKPKEEESEFAIIANRIEAELAGGNIHLDQFDQLIFTPDKSKLPIELHLSSSLVKSLSYLILYLRYDAKKDDQIIIDEPELNLHPDLQIALARVIAQMVNAGLKVVISTHSDYLIKELNNLLLLSKLSASEENRKFLAEHNYKSENILDGGEVSAYFLNDSTIIPIDIEENGIEVPSINDAMASIDSMSQEIFFRLEE